MDWISVKDRLPEEGKEVLCFVQESFHPYHVATYDPEHKKFYNKYAYVVRTTHWQPLPPPPKEAPDAD